MILGQEERLLLLLRLLTFVHCAARVHVMQDSASNPLQQFTAVNTDATLALAKAAAKAGVKRFIFISSIKVNGEYTLPGVPFTAADYSTIFHYIYWL